MTMVTKEFLKAVLAEEKDLLKIGEVRFVNAPVFDELSVKKLYDKMIELPGIAKYFPDSYAKGRQCCRSYMFNVWNTLYPGEVKEILDNANKIRYSVANEDIKKETVLIS